MFCWRMQYALLQAIPLRCHFAQYLRGDSHFQPMPAIIMQIRNGPIRHSEGKNLFQDWSREGACTVATVTDSPHLHPGHQQRQAVGGGHLHGVHSPHPGQGHQHPLQVGRGADLCQAVVLAAEERARVAAAVQVCVQHLRARGW